MVDAAPPLRRCARAAPGLLLLLALAGPLGAGEAPAPEAPRKRAPAILAPLRYLHERGADLMDVFELHVGAGRGAKLDLRYGVHFFGLGDVRSHRIGLLDRRVGAWREIDTQLSLFPLSLLAWPVERGARLCRWRRLAEDAGFVLQAGTQGVQHLDRKEFGGDPEFFLKDTVEGAIHTRWSDSFPIGAEVQAGVGVRFMLRPLQLADFLVGIVGVDLDPWLLREPGK